MSSRDASDASKVSEFTVRRLSLYLRQLRELRAGGTEVVSSRELAAGSGTTPAQVRKDLSNFGSFGKRGRGYRVGELTGTLEEILGLDRAWRVALLGAGKIGRALLGYEDLRRRGFHIVVAFDTDPEKVGDGPFGVPVLPVSRLEEAVRERELEIGILAVPPGAAQEMARRMVEAGLTGILNFAPVKLSLPPEVVVRGVDVALEMEGLSYALASAAAASREPRASLGDEEGSGAAGGQVASG